MISVCMATFNGAKYIREQLDSILLQLGKDDEIVISDDHSSDETLTIIAGYQDSRIKVFTNPNKGLIKNFENAISKSNGDYIFLADQDDIWLPNKVQVCISEFNEGYDLVLSDCAVFNSLTGDILHSSFYLFNGSKKGILKNMIRNSYIGCCMAFNKAVKAKVLPFPDGIPMHDSWIGIMSELQYRVKFNNSKLILYRNHSANASFTSVGKSKYSFLKKLSFRFVLAYLLIIRYFKF